MAWTYSDYVTLSSGAAKLTRLRLHIQEVSDRISGGSYTLAGISVSKGDMLALRDQLTEEEKALTRLIETQNGTRVRFARGRPLR